MNCTTEYLLERLVTTQDGSIIFPGDIVFFIERGSCHFMRVKWVSDSGVQDACGGCNHLISSGEIKLYSTERAAKLAHADSLQAKADKAKREAE